MADFTFTNNTVVKLKRKCVACEMDKSIEIPYDTCPECMEENKEPIEIYDVEFRKVEGDR